VNVASVVGGACKTIGDIAAISLPGVIPTSRLSGVAPLAVFFDTAGTTATATTRPFHDLEYRWSFGENPAVLAALPGGANWANGSTKGSRNLATGPVAAHVFEAPGTYTISLSATDGTHTVSNNCTQIVVLDPGLVFAGAKTTCVAAASLPVQGVGGCPGGANTAQQSSFSTAISSYALTGTRLLFKRGDTFSATSGSINKTGPGIVGAYGTGALPVVNRTGSSQILVLSSSTTPAIKDWRIMDLDFNGQSVKNGTNIGIDAAGGINQVLILRMNIRNVYRGVSAYTSILDYWNNNGKPGHKIFDEWAVVDSTVTGIPGCNPTSTSVCDWRVILAGKHSSIQGNFLDGQNTGGSHVIRSAYTGKGVFSNNTLARAGSGQHAIKLHAGSWTGAGVSNPGGVGTYTEQVIIADNKIIGGINPWTISLGPQNSTSDERVRDVIVERNWFTSGSASQLAIESSATSSTFRNNIFDVTGAAGHTGISVSRRGIEPVPSNVHIYNNTFYSGSTGNFNGVSLGAVTDTVVRNNLGSAPSASSPAIISGAGTGLVQSNNLLNNSPGALFVSATPTVPANFGLKPLPNPARDTGLATVPVFSDFFRLNRPQNGVIDIGAVEGP